MLGTGNKTQKDRRGTNNRRMDEEGKKEETRRINGN
jgi:hypothetical protein